MNFVSQFDMRIRLYESEITFLKLLPKDLQHQIENGELSDILLSPVQHYRRDRLTKQFPDTVERMIAIALTAKLMAEERTSDDRDILYGLTKILPHLLPNFNKEIIEAISQASKEEIEEFTKEYLSSIPKYVPRHDTTQIVVLKLEYIVNSVLYLGKSIHEERFPYANDFYKFLSFMIHEIFIYGKPFEEKERIIKQLCKMAKPFLSINTIIYFFDHFPEQASELVYILLNMDEPLKLTDTEKKLITDYLLETIIISNNYKQKLIDELNLS